VFKLCPKLEVLDNKDKDGNEVEYSDDEDDLDDVHTTPNSIYIFSIG